LGGDELVEMYAYLGTWLTWLGLDCSSDKAVKFKKRSEIEVTVGRIIKE